VKKTLPRREKASHKGTFGTSLLIAGTDEMPGSAILSAIGAIRSGTGKLIMATSSSVAAALASVVAEATFMLPGLLRISEGEIPKKLAAIGIGPGLTDEALIARALESLQDEPVPLVIDAGALLAKRKWRRKYPTIITPHPGEFSRLTGKTVED